MTENSQIHLNLKSDVEAVSEYMGRICPDCLGALARSTRIPKPLLLRFADGEESMTEMEAQRVGDALRHLAIGGVWPDHNDPGETDPADQADA